MHLKLPAFALVLMGYLMASMSVPAAQEETKSVSEYEKRLNRLTAEVESLQALIAREKKRESSVLARLGRVCGEFQMVITRCSIFEPPAKRIKQRLAECGIPFWPHGFVTAHCDIEQLLQHWTNEYACLGYGEDLYPALEDFCELTGIRSVAL